MAPLSLKIIEMMRAALARVENQAGLSSDDPALLEFKRGVVRDAAALEIIEAEKTDTAENEDVSEPKKSQSDNAA